MGPKTGKPDKPGKGRNRPGEGAPQASVVEFGLPQSVIASLQAIAARSTQDLWASPAAIPGDLTVEQQHSRQATASYKLSKRIAGDSKAKDDLAAALATWVNTIGLHLAGLVQRVRALGDKIDEDLMEACREMEATLSGLPSSTTQEKIQAASSKLGPVWTQPQAEEILRLASALRAFSVVPGMATGSGCLGAPAAGTRVEGVLSTGRSVFPGVVSGTVAPSAVSAPLAPPPAPAIAVTDPLGEGAAHVMEGARQRRWKRGNVALPHRPSKSPRREDPGALAAMGTDFGRSDASAPWLGIATGRTPEGPRRPAMTELSEDAELWPDPASVSALAPVSWHGAWTQAMTFILANGGEFIGELDSSPEQDAVWPLQSDPTAVAAVQSEAASFWTALGAAIDSNSEAQIPGIVLVCQELLQRIRLCPAALPGIQQGVVVALQTTLGNILDYQQYGPATAQETYASGRPGQLLSFDSEIYRRIRWRGLARHCCQAFYHVLSLGVGWGGSAVQVYRQGTWNGQPVYTTGGEYSVLSVSKCRYPSMLMIVHTVFSCTHGRVAWYQCTLPVDLRPVGGNIQVLSARRDHACVDVVRRALLAQGLPSEQAVLLRTSKGWFSPASFLLLLPELDSFQVWPITASSVEAIEGDSLPSVVSDDWFRVSLPYTQGSEAALHDTAGSNAVVIYSNGLFFTQAPSFADHLTLRSSVLHTFLASAPGDPTVPLHFARLLPPLDNLPPVQFVAMFCHDGLPPALVDLRPLGGALHVFGASMYDTPATRIQTAISQGGDPSVNRPLTSRLVSGELLVLHREVIVNPFVALQGQPPLPIVVVARRDNIASGFRTADPHHAVSDEEDEHDEVSPSPLEVSRGWGFQEGVPFQVPADRVSDWEEQVVPGLADVNAHYRLAYRLALPDSLTQLSWTTASGMPGSFFKATDLSFSSGQFRKLMSVGQLQHLPSPLFDTGTLPRKQDVRQQLVFSTVDGRDPHLPTCSYGFDGEPDLDSTAGRFDEALPIGSTSGFLPRTIGLLGRCIQRVAHLLHLPSGVAPPTPFWLLHFRGRGAVVAVVAPGFDWALVAQQAAEIFGGDFFLKSAFGVQHCGRVFPYGTQLPVPPHGAIISLVRMTQPSGAGFSTWDAPREAYYIPQFNYDICRGPLFEPAILASGPTVPPTRSDARRTSVPASDVSDPHAHSSMADLSVQLAAVTRQVSQLTARLEEAGVLEARAGTADPASTEEPLAVTTAEATNDPWTRVEQWGDSRAATTRCSNRLDHALVFLWVANRFGFLPGLLASLTLARAVDDEPVEPAEPSAPSSPSYSGVQPPTPDTTVEGEGLASTVRASDDAGASILLFRCRARLMKMSHLLTVA
ncbi:pol [Symbiodinium sp. CCMP2592]|nr:pol [Symbiodinium sp. CCMP2592]